MCGARTSKMIAFVKIARPAVCFVAIKKRRQTRHANRLIDLKLCVGAKKTTNKKITYNKYYRYTIAVLLNRL